MAKRPTGAKPAVSGLTTLEIACMGCGARSSIVLPGKAPFPGAVLQTEGWTVLNEPEEGHVVFACKACFEAEMESDDSKIKGEG
jgi:hypothetical protein